MPSHPSRCSRQQRNSRIVRASRAFPNSNNTQNIHAILNVLCCCVCSSDCIAQWRPRDQVIITIVWQQRGVCAVRARAKLIRGIGTVFHVVYEERKPNALIHTCIWRAVEMWCCTYYMNIKYCVVCCVFLCCSDIIIYSFRANAIFQHIKQTHSVVVTQLV